MATSAADIQAARQAYQTGGTVYFVATGGNNASDGKGWAEAKLTAAGATAVMTDGDTLVFGPGTFSATVLDLSGVSNVKVLGSGNRATILTRAATKTVTLGNGCSLENLTIVNTTTPSVADAIDAIYGSQKSFITIKNCTVTSTDAGIRLSECHHYRVLDNDIDASEYGIITRSGGAGYAPPLHTAHIIGNQITTSGWTICRAQALYLGDNQSVIVRDNVITSNEPDGDENTARYPSAITVSGASALVTGNKLVAVADSGDFARCVEQGDGHLFLDGNHVEVMRDYNASAVAIYCASGRFEIGVNGYALETPVSALFGFAGPYNEIAAYSRIGGNPTAVSSTTITLAAGTTQNDVGVGDYVWIQSGAGAGQNRIITAYNSGTRVATVAAWTTNPTTSSVYRIRSPQVYALPLVERVPMAMTIESGVVRANDANGAAVATSSALSTVSGYVDTEVAAIKAKTDNLPSDPADASDIASAFSTVNSTLATLAGYVDTEVAAIKDKTDQLTFTTANQVDARGVSFAANSITAAAIATDAFGALELAAGAATEIAAAVAAQVTTDHGSGSYVRNTEPPTAAAIDSQLSGVHGGGAWGGATSSGAFARTVTVTSDGTTPIIGATVRITGTTTDDTDVSDVNGDTAFNLDAGSYTLAATKAGYTYAASALTVSGAGDTTITMTAVSIPPASNPSQTNAWLDTYDGAGSLEPDVVIEFQLVDPTPSGSGSGTSYPGVIFEAVSDEDGRLTQLLKTSSSYQARRDHGEWVTFTSGSSGTYQLPEILGRRTRP